MCMHPIPKIKVVEVSIQSSLGKQLFLPYTHLGVPTIFFLTNIHKFCSTLEFVKFSFTKKYNIFQRSILVLFSKERTQLFECLRLAYLCLCYVSCHRERPHPTDRHKIRYCKNLNASKIKDANADKGRKRRGDYLPAMTVSLRLNLVPVLGKSFNFLLVRINSPLR